MDERTSAAVKWLLSSEEPSIVAMTHRDVLGEPPPAVDVLAGPIVTALFDGQLADGGFGGHPYRKWTGAHWRLVSLVELEIPAGEPRAMAATETVLSWLANPNHRVPTVDGLPRAHASLEGNAVAVCCRLGLATDERVEAMVDALVEWQWPDGGWNCDRAASGRRSSFHETLAPMWGLLEYWRATGDAAVRDAANQAAELFLQHRMFRSLTTGRVIDRDFLALRYPSYWHYNILQAMLVLSRMDLVRDPRCDEALNLIAGAQHEDGRWRARGYWWKSVGGSLAPEAVDWDRNQPSQMITLNALRVLHAAGRLS
jgi:hypothetical protein